MDKNSVLLSQKVIRIVNLLRKMSSSVDEFVGLSIATMVLSHQFCGFSKIEALQNLQSFFNKLSSEEWEDEIVRLRKELESNHNKY